MAKETLTEQQFAVRDMTDAGSLRAQPPGHPADWKVALRLQNFETN